MLREIRIRNFAVIDSVSASFSPGLNVLTGETGAGKSMLIDAILLVRGARAQADVIRGDSETATVEALFEVEPGSSAAAVLHDAGLALVEGHGQHEHQRLLEPARQLELLDRFADAEELLDRVADLFAKYRVARAEAERTRATERDRVQREDLLRFQLSELDGARLRAGEEEELRTERRRLQYAERLTTGLG